jgi:hypothetical protein
MPYIFGITSMADRGRGDGRSESLLFSSRLSACTIRCDIESARKLMFGSFIYLPVVQIA